MSYTLGTILLSPGTSQLITLPDPGTVQALKVTNKTPYDVQYSNFGTIGNDWLAAGTEYFLYSTVQNQGSIMFTAFNTVNITPANPAPLLVTLYVTGESLPAGHWPVSIPSQVVQAQVSQLATLTNAGNNPLTQVITMQPSDAATPTFSADNSGNFFIKGDNAGVLTTLIQLIAGSSPAVKLAAAGLIAEVLGGLKVDQTFECVGTANLADTTQILSGTTGSETRIVNTAGSDIAFYSPLGTQTGRLTNAGIFECNGLQLNSLPLTRMVPVGQIAIGTTQGTYTHTLGVVPDIVILQINGTSSTAGSVKVDYGTLTSTTFKATASVAVSAYGIVAKF